MKNACPSSAVASDLLVPRIGYALAASMLMLGLYSLALTSWFKLVAVYGLPGNDESELIAESLRVLLWLSSLSFATLALTFFRQATAWMQKGAFPSRSSLWGLLAKGTLLNVAIISVFYTLAVLLFGQFFLLLAGFLIICCPLAWKASELLIRFLFYGKGECRTA